MKDMGPISYFLGIQFHQTDEGISMDQSYYLKSILKRFKMEDCRSAEDERLQKHISQARMTQISEIQLLVAIVK